MTAGGAGAVLAGVPEIDGQIFIGALETAQHKLDRLIGLARLVVRRTNLVEVQDPIEDVIAAIERARLELVGLMR